MKRIVLLIILCLVCVFISACAAVPDEPAPVQTTAPAPTPAPTPEPTPTPQPCSVSVTIDGKLIHVCYGERDDILISSADLSELFGDAYSADSGEMIPLKSIVSDYTEYYDAETDSLYYTRLPDVNAIPDGISVPVLMYHAVSDDCWGASELFVKPSELEKQLQYLSDNGYTTISFEDLPRLAEIEKPVMLTFDDGYRDNYTELYPLLRKYQAKATVFVIGNCVGGDLYMTSEQVKELSDSGLVSIQSHTMTHPDLDELGRDDTVYELETSQLFLTRVTGKQPFVLCYPTGKNTELTREVAAEYYDFGIIMNGGRWTTGTDLFRIPRHYISRSTDIGSFAAIIG